MMSCLSVAFRVVKYACVGVLIAGLSVGLGYAQQLPNPRKPIVIVVPFPPPGTTDKVARIIARELANRFGQEVAIENRPGANTSIAAELVANSIPDGHTLLLTTNFSLLVSRDVFPTVSIRFIDDLAPVAKLATTPVVMMVSPRSGIKSVNDFAFFARDKGRVGVGYLGRGTPAHVAAEAFRSQAKIDFYQVPYRAMIPAYQDLISGDISVVFDSLATALPFIKEQRVKAVAVFQEKPSRAAPEIPSIDRSPFKNLYIQHWIGLFGPKQLRPEVRRVLHGRFASVLQSDRIAEELWSIGFEPSWEDGERFAKALSDEALQYKKAWGDGALILK